MEDKRNSCLNEFYNSYAKTGFSQAHILASTMKTTNDIVNRIKHEDDRFHGEMISVGSMGSHVPSVNFSECDVLYPVFIEGEIEQTDNPEYVRLKLSDSAKATWNDCSDHNKYLNPKLFSSIFHALVEKCLRLTVGDTTPVNLTGKGSVASTLQFMCPFVGVSVDIVVTVQCRGWPSWSIPDWFEVGDKRPWPRKETLKAIHDRGIELVANNFAQENGMWRLSYSYTETLLIDDTRMFYPSFRKLLIILKALRILHLVSPTEGEATPLFKSYHLKILVLQEALDFPETAYWSEYKLAERFASVLERLKCCIKRKFLKHLFLPEVNLFCHAAPDFLLKHELLTDDPFVFIEKVKYQQKKTKKNYFY